MESSVAQHEHTVAMPMHTLQQTRSLGPLSLSTSTYPAISFDCLSRSKITTNSGAGDRVRTDDIYLGKVMLCQLSYARKYSTNSYVNNIKAHTNSFNI